MEIELIKSGNDGNYGNANNADNADRLLTIDEVAKKLRVSHITLRRWDKDGKLKSIRVHARSRRLYAEKDIEDFIVNGPVSGRDPNNHSNDEGNDDCCNSDCGVIKKIALKKFGTSHYSAGDAERDSIEVEKTFSKINANDTIEIDLGGIEPIGMEWTNRFLVPFNRKHKGKIRLVNLSNIGDITFLELTGLHSPERFFT